MGRIQSNVGLVTGVPIQETVNQLMAINAIPRDRLQARTTQLQQEQVALTELTALVVGVELSTDRLGQDSLFNATKVSSSNAQALAVRSLGNPSTGSYSFVPVRLSQSQQLTSSLFSSTEQTFSEGEILIHSGGFLDESVSLDTLNGGEGVSRGSIAITDRSGNVQTIDLRFAQTAQDVVDAINANDSLNVTASLDGDRFVLTDFSTNVVTDLSVAEVKNGTTAADLGLDTISTSNATAQGASLQRLSTTTALNSLLDGRGLHFSDSTPSLQFNLADESQVSVTLEINDRTASLGQVLDAINDQADGKFEVRLASDGKSLEVEDLTTGAGEFSISSPNGDLAEQLGLDSAASGGVIAGDRLIAGLSDVLLSSLNGGRGFEQLGEIAITDRSGASANIDLSNAKTLNDVLDSINDSGLGVKARLNRTKTGIEIVDSTGSTASNLIVENADGTNSATLLQIESNNSTGRIDTGSLHLQHVGRNTLLKDYNGGTGITLSSIRFTDSAGVESALNLSAKKPETLGDLIDEINALSVGIEARINDTGDGLLLVDTAGGEGELQVVDVGTGLAAAQLGIAGTGKTETVGGETVTSIDGTTTVRIQTTSETTLDDLVESLNAYAGSPVSASILNLGDGNGVRLLLNSKASGLQGRVAIDSDVGLSFSETASAQDALIAFGATDNNGGVLVTSSTNDFEDVIEGVGLTINEASTTAVRVNVEENSSTLIKQVETFVSAYNKVREKLTAVTAFDEATNSVGVLFGSNAALRLDIGYSNFLTSELRGAGSIRNLGQIGLSVDEDGLLQFDSSKLQGALDTDAAAVKEFFTTEDFGFSAKAKDLANRLAGVESGVLLNRSNSLQSQIELNSTRIASFDIRLDRQRERLLKQFFTMETTIAKLQNNLTAINNIQFISPITSSSS